MWHEQLMRVQVSSAMLFDMVAAGGEFTINSVQWRHTSDSASEGSASSRWCSGGGSFPECLETTRRVSHYSFSASRTFCAPKCLWRAWRSPGVLRCAGPREVRAARMGSLLSTWRTRLQAPATCATLWPFTRCCCRRTAWPPTPRPWPPPRAPRRPRPSPAWSWGRCWARRAPLRGGRRPIAPCIDIRQLRQALHGPCAHRFAAHHAAQGGYGRVYQALYGGSIVAAKVL